MLLLSLIGSVNAAYYTVTIPETCTTSNYSIVLNDNTITTEFTATQLSAINFEAYAPVVTGIDNNIIYFETEKDLARVCSYVSYEVQSFPFNTDFKIYRNGALSHATVIKSTVSTYDGTWRYTDLFMDISSSQYGYIFSGIRNGDYCSCNLAVNGVQLYSYGTISTGYFGSAVFTKTTDVKFGRQGGVYSSRAMINTHTVTVFDYVDHTYSGDGGYSISVVMTPPERGNISIYTEPDVNVYEGIGLLGTTDNGGLLDLQLPIGEHVLIFQKEGYWNSCETVSIAVENNTELFVSLAPKNAIFQVSKEFFGDLYPNSVGTLSLEVTPVKDAYAAKLRVSGVEVNKVYYKTQEIPKAADGSYILGDVISTQNIEIQFKTPQSWGEKTFTVEISATDLEGTAYTNLETINYEVLELPFLLEMPETFGIGTNDITLTDQSGTAYSVLLVLYDSEGTEKWSSSTNLLEYCEYTFEVPIDDAGDYTLELNAKAGTVKTYYSIEIIEPVTLITEELTVNPGKIGTVQFKISNPTSNVKYYTASLTCPFLDGTINKTFSIAPGTVDKTVDISFEVPEGLELENYQLVLKIYDPDRTDPIYSGNVVLTISNESLIFSSVPGGNSTIILLAAAVLLIVGTFAALRLKK